jgi:hypothetical protein
MITRVLLAVCVVLTLVCGGLAIYYNRVFEGLQVALAETKAQLAETQARLKGQRSALPADQSILAPSPSTKARK